MRLSLVAERQEWSWLARSLLVYPLTQCLEQPLVQTVPGAACQSWRLLEEFSLLRCLLVALFAIGNLDFAFALVYFSPWCMGVACGVRRIGFGTRALLGLTVDTCSLRGFGRISSFSTLR